MSARNQNTRMRKTNSNSNTYEQRKEERIKSQTLRKCRKDKNATVYLDLHSED